MDTITIDRSTFHYLIITTQLEFTLRFLNSYFALSEAEGRDLFGEVESACWNECLQDPTQLKHTQRLIRRCAPQIAINFLKETGHFVRLN